MPDYVTTLYFTVTMKDGSQLKFECRGYEETPESHELVLTSGERRSFSKDQIKSCVCTGFAPFWVG